MRYWEIDTELHEETRLRLMLEHGGYSGSESELDDTRRPRLTLQHLQQLRKRKGADNYARQQHLQFLPDMYGAVVHYMDLEKV